MKKEELALFVAKKLGVPKHQAAEAMDSLFDHLAGRLLENGKVSIAKFGTFKLITARNRQYRHPRTGEVLVKPVSRRVKFLPRKFINDRL